MNCIYQIDNWEKHNIIYCKFYKKNVSRGVCKNCNSNPLKNDLEIKFNNCSFRSETKVTDKIKLCCGQWKEIEEFKCNKLNIFPLYPKKCESCTFFEEKSVNIQ